MNGRALQDQEWYTEQDEDQAWIQQMAAREEWEQLELDFGDDETKRQALINTIINIELKENDLPSLCEDLLRFGCKGYADMSLEDLKEVKRSIEERD